MRKIDVEYRAGEKERRLPACFLWEGDLLYVTHGALCALFMQSYQKLERTGKSRIKVGEKQSERVMHAEFIKKLLSEEGGEPVKIVSTRVMVLNQHTIKDRRIVGRTAEWCRVCWTEADGTRKANCLRVRLKELNSAYWEHASSFMLGRMGCRRV